VAEIMPLIAAMQSTANATPEPDEKFNVGFMFLGFFLPIVGIILYFVMRKDQPGKARGAGVGAIACIAITAIFFSFLGIMSSFIDAISPGYYDPMYTDPYSMTIPY